MWTSDHVKSFPGHQGDTHFQVKNDHLGNWRKGVDSTLLKFKIILWKKFYLLRTKVQLQVQPRSLDIFTISPSFPQQPSDKVFIFSKVFRITKESLPIPEEKHGRWLWKIKTQWKWISKEHVIGLGHFGKYS